MGIEAPGMLAGGFDTDGTELGTLLYGGIPPSDGGIDAPGSI
jgi:hypothetical protein